MRYPGAKRRLAGYIKAALEKNNLKPALFIEPFAGGASVALQLLHDGAVQTIGLVEADPLVAAFWQVVFSDEHEWLVDQVNSIDVTLDRWREFKSSVPETTRQRALACIFLNRTSFSGIIARRGGPIGGHRQASGYNLDCRFTRPTLVKRIYQAAALRDKVAFVYHLPYDVALRRIRRQQRAGKLPDDVFYYFDPPYFEEADRLYNFYFTDQEHRRFRNIVSRLASPYILSYDSAPAIHKLYRRPKFEIRYVQLLYSTSNLENRSVDEAIITNLANMPLETRLWRRNEEWMQAGRPAPADHAAVLDAQASLFQVTDPPPALDTREVVGST